MLKRDFVNFLELEHGDVFGFVKKFSDMNWKFFNKKKDVFYSFNNSPRILFVCEIDIESGSSLKVVGKQWFGRDVLNRAGVLVLLDALKQVNDSRFGVVIVDKDFKNFGGFVKKFSDIELVVCVKPTNLNLITSVKGVLDIDFSINGLEHDSLVSKNHDVLNDFFEMIKSVNLFDLWQKEHYEQKSNFFNVTSLNSNESGSNVVNRMTGGFKISYNFLNSGVEVFNRFKAISNDFREFKLVNDSSPYLTDVDEFFFKKLKSSVSKHTVLVLRASSIPGFEKYYNNVSVNTTQFGLSGNNQGLSNEYLDYSSLNKFEEVIKSFLK